jgi:hypothetical protein
MQNVNFFGTFSLIEGPKFEIFHLFTSLRFYTIKHLWICDFGDEMKNKICFNLGFQVCLTKILF